MTSIEAEKVVCFTEIHEKTRYTADYVAISVRSLRGIERIVSIELKCITCRETERQGIIGSMKF